jgi:hypothetical protein
MEEPIANRARRTRHKRASASCASLTRSDGRVYGLSDCVADISVISSESEPGSVCSENGTTADREAVAATALSRVLICLAVLVFFMILMAVGPRNVARFLKNASSGSWTTETQSHQWTTE